MNPFLHNPVASSALHPRVPPFCGRRPASRPARRNWARTLGSLALATGMSLAAAPALALDVNTATADQLSTVRGLGPRTAAIIVKERDRGGRFESMEDLSDRVRGIGQRKAQALQAAGLKVDSPSAAGAGNAARSVPGRTGTGQPGAARPDAARPGTANTPAARQRTPPGFAGGMRDIR